VAAQCRELETDQIIDLGAGQGYLARTLAFVFGLSVTAIERDGENAEKGAHKAQELHKKKEGSLQFVAVEVRDSDAICRLASERGRCVLVALHACGDLSICAQEAFVRSDAIAGLLCVPCCYSKRVVRRDEPEAKLFVSKSIGAFGNTLNEGSLLAASCSPVLSVSQNTVFRCMLSLFCAEKNWPAPEKVRVSTGAASFIDYAIANLSDSIDLESVREFEKRNLAECERRVKALWTLKNVIGRATERLVLSDRIEGLREAGTWERCELVQLFDPTESPRCACIVCFRRKKL
jgi:hypothetical protein